MRSESLRQHSPCSFTYLNSESESLPCDYQQRTLEELLQPMKPPKAYDSSSYQNYVPTQSIRDFSFSSKRSLNFGSLEKQSDAADMCSIKSDIELHLSDNEDVPTKPNQLSTMYREPVILLESLEGMKRKVQESETVVDTKTDVLEALCSHRLRPLRQVTKNTVVCLITDMTL